MEGPSSSSHTMPEGGESSSLPNGVDPEGTTALLWDTETGALLYYDYCSILMLVWIDWLRIFYHRIYIHIYALIHLMSVTLYVTSSLSSFALSISQITCSRTSWEALTQPRLEHRWRRLHLRQLKESRKKIDPRNLLLLLLLLLRLATAAITGSLRPLPRYNSIPIPRPSPPMSIATPAALSCNRDQRIPISFHRNMCHHNIQYSLPHPWPPRPNLPLPRRSLPYPTAAPC